MQGRSFYRTALGLISITLLFSTGACSKHHVEVTFDLPAEHHLPGVGSVTVGQFTGAAGEDTADLLMHDLEQTGPYAMFRQATLRDLPVADNFYVASGFAGNQCTNFESDAVLYGSTQAQAPQVSYTAVATHGATSRVGADGRYEATSSTSRATTAHATTMAADVLVEDEAPPAYTEVDEGPFFDCPPQAATPSQQDDLPPPYSVEDNNPVPRPAPAPPASANSSETRGARTSRQSVETKICRHNSQTVRVTLKVGLRQGLRDHLTVVSQKRVHAPTACVVVPGRISLHQAPYYFHEIDHMGMHHAALVEAIDALTAKFVPRKVSEQMVLFSDKKIALSKQALTAASAGDWTLAASYYARGVEYAQSHNLKSQQRARVHYNYGIALAGKGDFPQALQQLTVAESADKNDVYAEARMRVARYEGLAQQARQQREDVAHFRQTASCMRR